MNLASFILICGIFVVATSATFNYPISYGTRRSDLPPKRTRTGGPRSSSRYDVEPVSGKQNSSGETSTGPLENKNSDEANRKSDQSQANVYVQGYDRPYVHPGPMYLLPVGDGWKSVPLPSLGATGSLNLPGGINFGFGERDHEEGHQLASAGVHGEGFNAAGHVGGLGSEAVAGIGGGNHGENIHHGEGGPGGSISAAGTLSAGFGSGSGYEGSEHQTGGHQASLAAAGSLAAGFGGGSLGDHIHQGTGGPGAGLVASGGFSGNVVLPIPAFILHHFHRHHGNTGVSLVEHAEPFGGIEYQGKQYYSIPSGFVQQYSHPYIIMRNQPPVLYRQVVQGGFPRGGAVHGPLRDSEHQIVISGIPNIHASGFFGLNDGVPTGQGGIFTTAGNPIVISLPVSQTPAVGQPILAQSAGNQPAAGQAVPGQSQFVQFIQRPFQFLGSIFQPQQQAAAGGRLPEQSISGSGMTMAVPVPLGNRRVDYPTENVGSQKQSHIIPKETVSNPIKHVSNQKESASDPKEAPKESVTNLQTPDQTAANPDTVPAPSEDVKKEKAARSLSLNDVAVDDVTEIPTIELTNPENSDMKPIDSSDHIVMESNE